MIVFLAILSAGFSCVTYMSLLGERDRLENCKQLGLECEPGRFHELTEELWKSLEQLKDLALKQLN